MLAIVSNYKDHMVSTDESLRTVYARLNPLRKEKQLFNAMPFSHVVKLGGPHPAK